jgi:SsrA-binding protein
VTPKPKSNSNKKIAEKSENYKLVANNRRARYEYEILETFECGIELKGAEVKSIRVGGRLSLTQAYCQVEKGQLWLHLVNIAPYEYSSGFGTFDPNRKRKLLAHKEQIDFLYHKTQEKSWTIVPLSVYFKNGKVKVTVALAKGKKTYDKRAAIIQKDLIRESDRELKNRLK